NGRVPTMSTRISPVGDDLVWVTGRDAVRFLNDLIRQEIANLEPGQVRRSLLLSPQGKLDHILWVLRGHDQVGLITDSGRGPELAATLNRYRTRVKADIEIEERDRWVVVGGDGGDGWSGDRTGSVDADISWGDLTRTLVVGGRPDLEVLTPDEYQSLRIGAGE